MVLPDSSILALEALQYANQTSQVYLACSKTYPANLALVEGASDITFLSTRITTQLIDGADPAGLLTSALAAVVWLQKQGSLANQVGREAANSFSLPAADACVRLRSDLEVQLDAAKKIRTEVFRPRNPFTLPELKCPVFPKQLVAKALDLASDYIAARARQNVSSAEKIDIKIGAFLREEFNSELSREHALFRVRLMTVLADCNAAFGSLDHRHSQWAYSTLRV